MKIRDESVIAIDFDGTIVKHNYPEIGDPVPDALRVIQRLQREKRCRIILLTVRGGRLLRDAIGYLKKNQIELYGANENPRQPGSEFRHSKKVWYDHLIDDAAIGTPLIETESKPYVDWAEVERLIFK